VQRLELWMSLFAGAAGGLFGVLWHGAVSAVWLRALDPPGTGRRDEPLAELVAGAVLRAGAGVVLGLLFWMSWGLIAIVNAPWYAAGAAFALLAWAGLALLASASLTATGVRPAWLLVHAVEWLATCIAVGLLCAYAWQR
jgi:hypothetical protein